MSPSKPANRVQTAYLGLGGNLGDRRALLAGALARLAATPEVRIARVSPVYETAALCLPDQDAQPDFLNLVVELETTLTPHALLAACLIIEQQLGRIRAERWGPRTIDLDVLLFANTTLSDDRLILPHPRLHERAFVLVPLADLAPDLIIHSESVRTHAARADTTGVVARPELALTPPVLLEEVTLPCPPHEFFHRIAGRDHAFFLDSGRSTNGLGAYSFIGFEPFHVFRTKHQPDTLGTLKTLLARYHRPNPVCNLISDKLPDDSAPPALPFTGGAVGFFGYELCTQLEKLPRVRPDDLPEIPDCEFAFYDALIAHEHATGRTWIVANPVATTPAAALLARLRETLSSHSVANPVCNLISYKPGIPTESKPTANFDFYSYKQAIGRIKNYIASGDVYQVNLTQRFSTPLPCAPYDLYLRLRDRSPAPFAAYLSYGPVQLISSSPERFLTLRERHVETRPIKGTRPRSADPTTDAALAAELLSSEKDRAELLMIVDLERNDLGRVCEFGSVRVDQLWRLESHPTVHHLVSTVSGQLRAGLDIIDCVRASFPGGSITGAPKIRSMQIIDELEPHRRHIYTGAIGYIGFDGNADLNIAIRTITCVNNHAYYHVGGGIVWDSEPAAEYQETLDKGRAMHEALTSPA
ncbi:aminodeoxychorismate synthase component I [Rariglobus hedericola]|uniref:Aminodeoxychorismate synthase component I n=1 Tax=Rariglobus hedericola TaxID=2597822 RepID=A0A556QMJ1_9BACT|nr:aminodeoxychorismate synthase component I [Rariglobus hedericola]TSJ77870.1 aminodeoxychorismate synthase component I [Rariglobus hedericola]